MLNQLKKWLQRFAIFNPRSSIKSRVLQATLIAAVAVFSITATIADHLIDLWLIKKYDQSLLDQAKILVTLSVDRNGQPELQFSDKFMPEYSLSESPGYFQIWHGNGQSVARSTSLGQGDLSWAEAA